MPLSDVDFAPRPGDAHGRPPQAERLGDPPGRSLDFGHWNLEIESKSGQVTTSAPSDAHWISGKNPCRDPPKVRTARILTRSRRGPACRNRVIVRPPEGGRSLDLEFSPPEIEWKSGVSAGATKTCGRRGDRANRTHPANCGHRGRRSHRGHRSYRANRGPSGSLAEVGRTQPDSLQFRLRRVAVGGPADQGKAHIFQQPGMLFHAGEPAWLSLRTPSYLGACALTPPPTRHRPGPRVDIGTEKPVIDSSSG